MSGRRGFHRHHVLFTCTAGDAVFFYWEALEHGEESRWGVRGKRMMGFGFRACLGESDLMCRGLLEAGGWPLCFSVF